MPVVLTGMLYKSIFLRPTAFEMLRMIEQALEMLYRMQPVVEEVNRAELNRLIPALEAEYERLNPGALVDFRARFLHYCPGSS